MFALLCEASGVFALLLAGGFVGAMMVLGIQGWDGLVSEIPLCMLIEISRGLLFHIKW